MIADLKPYQAYKDSGVPGLGAVDLPLRASSECWFIWSISSIWLITLEIHPEEPDRPERPANQTDKPRARCASTEDHQAPAPSFLFQ
jgi:hypothetical protein